ncbi:helix-turn-helix transcriptional regulator [Planotetraspora kaengkrachanensis]|uniref:Transcriptional regulator n=1 Tax=Planotetraspora kaengkrachanensis TaxID=575193 RepID=A0A8J3PSH8_9ACTN|nr:helix-turn-helix transcriptional regulator [Planotetraspora kaengkrachanensis]GIG79459.1 transcriptional regulator [Planotetraspora kaengkrachanensis]
MDGKSPLGEFLRARRQTTTVDQVGLPNIGSRRTPGLRRDEVAMLAGVSADYYIRLEQGRERNPSDQVLDALARVFQLDAEATEHLHDLAHHRASRREPVGPSDQLRPYVLRFMEGCDHAVAFVLNRRLDFLARNPLAAALYDGMEGRDNLLRLLFLNPVAREFYLNWRQQAEDSVGHFRAALGAGGDDPFAQDLVEELSRGSEDFRRIWARHEVRSRTHWSISYRHGVVGEMTLHYEMFRVGSPTSQQLIVGQAEPYTPSERAFRELGRLAGKTADQR